MTELRLAIDPGIGGTGVSPWLGKKPLPLVTLYARDNSRSWEFRAEILLHKVELFCRKLQGEHNAGISQVVIEDWQKHIPRERAQNLAKMFEFRGMVAGWFFSQNIQVLRVGKGTVSKSEADMVAKAWGLADKSSEHSRDAFHLALLAGFHR